MKLQQPDLTPDPQPKTVTVNGAGLLHWGERAKANEVHIYRMDVKDSSYVLHILWLDGRTLYQHGSAPAAVPSYRPLRESQRPAAIQEAFGLFK